jgi:hypothetical protein
MVLSRVFSADVFDDAGIAEAGVEQAGRLVVTGARNRADRTPASVRYGVTGNLRISVRLRF